ncbi:transmembrane protein [Achlya hypogyna]|uniref:Transmembrane protein n=1 Tax=Achlya hypogyna TaxID=1202772 RepID=A0A1V9ZNX3_ACHHY|nr:transmembrane protein [Achlya hypogyna]
MAHYKKPKGTAKPNVAGERYDSNAIPVRQPTSSSGGMTPEQRAQIEQMTTMMKSMGMPMPPGMTPDRMLQAMNSMGMGGMLPGMGGGMPGMPGMPGLPGMPPGMAGLMPPGMDESDMEGMAGMMGMPTGEAVVYCNVPYGTDFKRWATFYPNYIDSDKTNAMGRRIPKAMACDRPIVEEMAEVCRYFKLDHVIEPHKAYSRESLVAGRVRVKLTDANGKPCNSDVRTRKELMLKMGELIPKLQLRKDRLQRELEAAKAPAGATAGAASAAASKKKGKKKGRR